MIWFDITKSGPARQKSGLMRLNQRLREELGGVALAADWNEVRESAKPGDWFVTSELFSEEERPGFGAFLRDRQMHTAAIFSDAIPLKFPHITWPHSVARHPSYLKLLSRFERVWAASQASADELRGYWQWAGLASVPPVSMLPLGADFTISARVHERPPTRPRLLCVGILEPRKNQMFLLDVCEELWADGVQFELHLVGRVNPHFGRPIAARVKVLSRKYSGLHHHVGVDDEALAALYAAARATVFPTIAEGCGLPVLESLWMGVPCLCSDLPVLLENATGGGCAPLPVNDRAAWAAAIRDVVTDPLFYERLEKEAQTRPLPTWTEAAAVLKQHLR